MNKIKSLVLIVLIVLLARLHLASQSELLEFSRPGIEFNTNFEIDRKDNLDFGVNYLFTGDYLRSDSCCNFCQHFSSFQFGPSLTFSPVKAEDKRIWRMSLGLAYTQFVDFYGVYGISTRLKGMTVLNGDGMLFENFGLKCELGLSLFSLVNIYYGYTFPIKDYHTYSFKGHSITLTLNLNMSFWAFGLQGM